MSACMRPLLAELLKPDQHLLCSAPAAQKALLVMGENPTLTLVSISTSQKLDSNNYAPTPPPEACVGLCSTPQHEKDSGLRQI